jgi:hypothetical protein
MIVGSDLTAKPRDPALSAARVRHHAGAPR